MSKDHPRDAMAYIQGGIVANGPTLLLFLAISFVDADIEAFVHRMNISMATFSTLLFLLILVSAGIAGFLVAGRVYRGYIRTGTYTGAFSFLFFILYKIFFYPSGIVADFWTLVVFLVGGGLGGFVRRFLRTDIDEG